MRRILKVAAFIMSAAFIMLIFACPQKAEPREPKEPTRYTVTFNKNADDAFGTMSSQIVVQGTPTALQKNQFTRSNFEFLGWATSPNGEKVYDDGESITIESSITLYAMWKINKYTVSFDPNGGTGTMQGQTFSHGISQNLAKNTFTRENYTFIGWATSSDGSKVYNDEQSISITSDMTLYAKWALDIVYVTFDKNDPNATGTMEQQMFAAGISQALNSNSFENYGYHFIGWATSPDGAKVYNDGDTITIATKTTLYAVWELNEYTVSFDSNGGTGTMTPQVFTHGVAQNLSANSFSYGYHTFSGWATSPSGTVEYDDKASFTATSEETLYAVWEPNKYTVTFNSNGGTGTMEPQVFTYGVPQNLSANNFSYSGYNFSGWAMSAGGAKVYDNQASYSATNDITLYAVWEGALVSISVTRIFTGEYLVGETIKKEDITVTAHYSGGFSQPVTTWTWEINETFTEPETDKEITIFYTEDGITKTDTFTISIVANEYTITYSFTETATVLDGHDGTAGTSWTYVQFGDWPQTIKADDVRILERQKLETGLFTYYAGSDGNWYVKQEENAAPWDVYKYSDGTQVAKASAGTSKYFKVEPIKWRVLEEKDGKKFLLAENGLMAVQYYDGGSTGRTIGGSTFSSNNYEHSKIRAWLNGYNYPKYAGKYYGNSDTYDCTDHQDKGFLQTAFTSVAQAKIAITTVDNSLASTLDSGNQYVCEDTDDKVFLLSRKEATTATYGFNTDPSSWDEARIRMPTDFALATGAYYVGVSRGSYWWLRSPEPFNYDKVYHTKYTGDVDYRDIGIHNSFATTVPALWITP